MKSAFCVSPTHTTNILPQLLLKSDEKEFFFLDKAFCGQDGKFVVIELANNQRHYYPIGMKTTFADLLYPMSGDYLLQKKDPLVTFIIPTIGRSTLVNSLQSLEDMKSNLWNALVVFDHVEPTIAETQRVKILPLHKKIGFANCAGEVRNAGIRQATTEWMAFLDDDDTVTPDYMYRLQQEIYNHPHASVIIFRMVIRKQLMPSKSSHFSVGDVGISFAMKRKLYTQFGLQFFPNGCEDFDLLHRIQQGGHNIHISNYITYLVRPHVSE